MKITQSFCVLIFSLIVLTSSDSVRGSSEDLCFCPPSPPVAEEYKQADLVFVGRYTGTEIRQIKDVGNDTATVYQMHFEVEKSWKGVDSSMVYVIDTGGSCSVGAVEGEKWLVYAHSERYCLDNDCTNYALLPMLGLCSRSAPLNLNRTGTDQDKKWISRGREDLRKLNEITEEHR